MFWYILGAVILGAVALAVVVWWFVKSKRKTKCGNWKAWHDRMPGPGRTATLHVTGECSFPTAGYAVELKRHAPQGINPAYLLLDKTVREPSGPAAQVITVVPVKYAEATDFKYEFVTILPDEKTIPVQEVR